MGRPTNLVVLSTGGTVMSVSPKALRSYLRGVSEGHPTPLTGKALGTVFTDLTEISTDCARALTAELTPESETQTTELETPTVTPPGVDA